MGTCFPQKSQPPLKVKVIFCVWGVASPLLANVYLHHLVVGFENRAEAERFFCCLSSMSRAAYSPLPLPSLRRTVWTFVRCPDYYARCRLLPPGQDQSIDPQSRFPDQRQISKVSSTTFRTQPPNLHPVPLMDMGFAVTCPLARHGMQQIRFLY